MSEYVDRDELRRKLEEAIERNADADSSWGRGWRAGAGHAIRHLNDMPPLEVPRGWSRDELLAAIDAGGTVECRSVGGGWHVPLRAIGDHLWEDLMSAMSAVLGVDDEAIDLATDLLEAIQPHIYREVRDAALLAKVRAVAAETAASYHYADGFEDIAALLAGGS